MAELFVRSKKLTFVDSNLNFFRNDNNEKRRMREGRKGRRGKKL